MVKNISNLGDAAVYCDFGSEVNETINSSVIDYFHHISKLIKDKKIEGITNLTPSYNKLIISFDLTITNYKKIKDFIEGLIKNHRNVRLFCLCKVLFFVEHILHSVPLK